MGFPEARSRKALLLNRNSIEAAMEWLLEHGEDPAADTPLTEAQLRALAAPGGATSVVQPDPDALQQLVEMGFDEQQAAEALRATFNDQVSFPCGSSLFSLPHVVCGCIKRPFGRVRDFAVLWVLCLCSKSSERD
jgi:uncharacterized UBP type Zn finger protein